ncbi:SDR family NAD(P)-dependent oxidoreductase [Paenibacillus naphthalenovorans]|uniref:SDR family NAD(P)-dependent oxidoreductase n=1 Tax=Paenibacillus naphthalenovorans TaxID=162209 RepID=UPI0008921AE3|nr:SDR family NAD(P)-dependent oxidoreductase [Paenibacillus naphthalenovorans]GCL71856.1 short-chain dehydrogenase [Paenibacillus naphthalenovorans]SDI40660.1 NAD(P)-dependent dehydrogenase, short-chain alcohol dehydrogenase family [Paenibacillus naphthalenovorans]
MRGRLAGKVALITGASRGLGALEAVMFAKEGAQAVIVSDVSRPALQETVKAVEELGGAAAVIPLELNVTLEEDWIQAAISIEKRFGKLDILVNNAGITKRERFVDCSLADWNQVIAVNQTGVFLGMKYSAPLLRKSGRGSIINMSSIAGVTGYFAAPYTASKWAVRGMTKAAAQEFGGWGIRVNSVNPGFIWTPLTLPAKPMVEAFNKVNALERAGEPEEVAQAVIFLASDESSYMTGGEITLDGGMTAGGEIRLIAKELGIYRDE